MNKIFPIGLVVLGVILVIEGINATNSFGSDVSRFFTGAPTDKAVWLLLAGTAAAVLGVTMTWRRSGRV